MRIPNGTDPAKRYSLFLTISVLVMLAGSMLLKSGFTDDRGEKGTVPVPQDTAPSSVVEAELAAAKPAATTTSAEQAAPFDMRKAVEVVATGYTAGVESTGKTPAHPEYGVTFSGVKVRRGNFSTIAADPNVFPLGTIMYIPGYGYGVVADTGSAIKGKKIDLYYETVDQVFNLWGKKKVKVIVLKKGDGQLSEQMLDRLNAITTFRADMPPHPL